MIRITNILGLIGFISCLLIHATAGQCAVIYVKTNAKGANNGNSWANAYPNLQSALAGAKKGNEIWVAQGT